MSDLVAKPRHKILFSLPDGEWHKHTSETIWAEEASVNQYQLLNIPFFMKGVSFHDVVSTKTGEDPLEVENIIDRGGHSTYRIYPLKTESGELNEEFENVVKKLEALGCRYESGLIGELPIYAFDIPSQVDAESIYQLLIQFDKNNVLRFEMAHDGHPPARGLL